jgi:hypothetical protein
VIHRSFRHPIQRPSAGSSLLPALGVVLCLFPLAGFGGTTNSWRVFQPLSTASLHTGTNTVRNPGMETPSANPPLAVWRAYDSGYTVGTNIAHSGVRSLQCTSANATDVHGGYQTILLNQTAPKPILLSGWSKAQNVTGSSDTDYSVYLDIFYTNGTPLYGQTVSFSVGTHDWEYQEAIIQPTQPIGQIYCYLLFRNSHTGTAWFDDIAVSEIQDALTPFDGAPVLSGPPDPLPFNTSNRFTLLSGDGLQVQVSEDGGVVCGLADGTNDLHVLGSDYASGWLVCDRRSTSGWWNVGGWVTASNGSLQQRGNLTNLNLAAEITYFVTNYSIRAQVTVSNQLPSDRAISVCFALPAAMDGGYWWNSPRNRVGLDQAIESATLTDAGWGARNLVSQYPLATVAAGSALTLSQPPQPYRPCRFVYNRLTHQFYAVFDLGISAITTNFPRQVTAEIWLYRSDSAWGLRSGLAGLYGRFPSTYHRAFTNEGIWVAFADIRSITNVSDFGIAYHEIGYSPTMVKADDTNGIPSFRYVSEPWSYWMNMPSNISNTNYASVYSYLLTQYSLGSVQATATLSSGIRDEAAALQFFPAAQPWCPYGAAFYLNASPFIADPVYSINKFSQDWNSTVRAVYNHPENGILDGEYIDSFGAYGSLPDYATNHQAGTSMPLLYTATDSTLMTPLFFGTLEMAQAIAGDVHALGKPIIGNAVFVWPYVPVGQGLFDFAGSEINWFDAAGNWISPADGPLLYARALSGQRPYGYLMNTDFTKVSHAEMETYMRLCAFYAIYPSAFSADASSNNYFEQPSLYERDRDLFRKYVPIVRAMSLAGWQPVTDATSDTPNVGLERYGTNSISGTRFLSLRNFSASAVTTTVTFDVRRWANPDDQWLLLTNLFDGDTHSISTFAGSNSVSVQLQPYECRAYAVQARPLVVPVILVNDSSFGFQQGRFGFQVSATPGQAVVIETALDFSSWYPMQTNVTFSNGLSSFSDPASSVLTSRLYRARLQFP